MTRTCRTCQDEFNPDACYDGTHRHRDVGFANQCGPCGETSEEEEGGERYMALEEAPPGGGSKGSCEVTPIRPSQLGGKGSGMGRHVLYAQHCQPIGCRKQ
jgi:hypothetical protein